MPDIATEVQQELERMIGRLVVHNTTLTVRLAHAIEALAAAQAALKEKETDHGP